VLKTPADRTIPPNDVDFFAMSKNEVDRSKQPHPGEPTQTLAAAAVTRPLSGHMLDMATR
jgi:hypothetical protein